MLAGRQRGEQLGCCCCNYLHRSFDCFGGLGRRRLHSTDLAHILQRCGLNFGWGCFGL